MWYCETAVTYSWKCHVSVKPASGLPVCSDIDSTATSGTMKNTAR